MGEATPGERERQGRVGHALAPANLVSFARLPLALAFALVDAVGVRVAVLGAAAASDLLDGWLARRLGPSRLGAVLDPVTDKVFMLTAFGMLALDGALAPVEVAGVLLRDMLTPLGYLTGVVLGRPFSMPARAGGKAVTTAQSLTLFAWLLGSPYLKPLAWATAAIGLYAVADYGRMAVRHSERTHT
ncbi:MAG: CDP-alcohol phosphatidyltransferase family protein [Gemmatimonadetes bacterium]|nr:CDP-alcohol phosphatidyltransferase family protein [Gemmatimonadota bacterium]